MTAACITFKILRIFSQKKNDENIRGKNFITQNSLQTILPHFVAFSIRFFENMSAKTAVVISIYMNVVDTFLPSFTLTISHYKSLLNRVLVFLLQIKIGFWGESIFGNNSD